jgi:hypothetical protein
MHEHKPLNSTYPSQLQKFSLLLDGPLGESHLAGPRVMIPKCILGTYDVYIIFKRPIFGILEIRHSIRIAGASPSH